MKSFVLAVASVVVIAIGASVLLNTGFARTADQTYVTQGVRLNSAH
jgi:hypothetical protein